MTHPPSALPATMRTIEVPQPGGADVLCLGSRPLPLAAPGEVLIEIAYAGVNRPDILQRQGNYPAPKDASDILGLEVSGTVVAQGPGVSSPLVGEKVCALLAGGGYAGYCSVSAVQCLPVPKGLSLAEAAALPETFFTVWSNLVDRVRLKKGETFLVHGGASGIGTTAIQMARFMGARVFTTAGNDEKCRACEKLGAERAVNYTREDFVAVLREATNDKGVDVILDMVGGDYIARNISLLAKEGRMVNIAYQKGAKAEVNFLPVMLKRLTITGSTLRIRETAYKGALAQALRREIWPAIEKGLLRPVIFKVFPLEEAAKAHQMMESSTHTGKIVLEVNPRSC